MIEIDIWENKLEEAEAHAAYQAVMDRCVSDGRIVKAMEEKIGELREVPYVIATPNGTSALLLASKDSVKVTLAKMPNIVERELRASTSSR